MSATHITDECSLRARRVARARGLSSGWLLAVFFATGLTCHWLERPADESAPIEPAKAAAEPFVPPGPLVVHSRQNDVSIDDWLGLKPKTKPKQPTIVEEERRPEFIATRKQGSSEKPQPNATEDASDRPSQAPAEVIQDKSMSQTNDHSNTSVEEVAGQPPSDISVTEFTWGEINITPSKLAVAELFPAPSAGPGTAISLPAAMPDPNTLTAPTSSLLPSGTSALRTPSEQDRYPETEFTTPTDRYRIELTADPALKPFQARPQVTANQYPTTGTDSVLQREQRTRVAARPQRSPTPPRRPVMYQASGSPTLR